MRLSPDAQIRFFPLFASLATQHTKDNVKSRARERYVEQQFVDRRQKKLSAPRLEAGLFGGPNDRPPFSRFRVGTPCHIVTDAYVVATAIHSERLVMSGHPNPI